MLSYLVLVTSDLMSAGIIFAMIYSFLKYNFKEKLAKTAVWAGIISVVLSAVMTALLNSTNAVSQKLNLGYLSFINIGLYLTFAASFIIFLIFTITPVHKGTKLFGDIMVGLATVLLIFTIAFYKLPTVFAYPFNFDLAEDTVFSSDFLLRFSGCLLAFVLVLVTSIAAYKAESTIRKPFNSIFLYLVLLIQSVYFAGEAVRLMLTRRIIHRTDFLFHLIVFVNNYSKYFIMAIMLVAVIAAVFQIFDNIKVTEEYSNPAQFRKIKATMRRRRRWSVVLIICVIIASINLTVIDAYNNKEPDETPVESAVEDGDNLVVPFSMVDDGHLHCFGYKTDDGVLVKFIVVQKPGTTSYGVGLDACDICGDAGYYERDDQIVCRRCDVVMNKNTIGFKGGCNPIVIDYEVKNGKITVPKKTLVEHEKEFE